MRFYLQIKVLNFQKEVYGMTVDQTPIDLDTMGIEFPEPEEWEAPIVEVGGTAPTYQDFFSNSNFEYEVEGASNLPNEMDCDDIMLTPEGLVDEGHLELIGLTLIAKRRIDFIADKEI